MAKEKEKKLNIFGKWVVSTEDDQEGKSPHRQLGTHTGYIDEIALKLSGEVMYSIYFKKYVPIPREKEKELALENKWVDVVIEDCEERNLELLALQMEKAFSERPVVVERSNYFRSFKIRRKNT